MSAGAPRCSPRRCRTCRRPCTWRWWTPAWARRAAGSPIAAGECILVGPDNGLLSWAVAALGGATAACQLTNGELWLHPVSPTFHGRDIFTPVAAHLAAGTSLEARRAPRST